MKMNREELLEALSAVSPGLANNDDIEQSACFVFVDNDVITFNDDIAVRHPFPCELEGAVRAKEFYQLLNKTKAEEINLETNDNELILKTKRSKAGIRMESEISIPIEEIGKPTGWLKLPKDFSAALQLCIPITGTNLVQPELKNVLLEGNHALSSDGDRFAEYKFDDADFEKILVPASALKFILDYPVEKYTITPSWVHFQTKGKKGIVLSCRLYDEEYSDMSTIKQILLMEGDTIKFPKDTQEILTRAGIFSESLSDGSDIISITLENNWMVVSAEGDYGWIEEKSRIKYKDTPLSFQIHPSVLNDILDLSHYISVGKSALKFEAGSFVYLSSLAA